MRRSKHEAAETRRRIVETAAAEFRQNGIEGTGLADVMTAAGLTHGGFYRHFESKDQLVAEACVAAIDSMAERLEAALSDGKPNGLAAATASYLSVKHRDNRSQGCPFAALGSELGRADGNARAVATEGLLKIADLISKQLGGRGAEGKKIEALAAFSALVGALTLARIISDPKLSALLLHAVAKCFAAKQRS
jgi:TetR/AcrR family transcriptional repressor of nem operon